MLFIKTLEQVIGIDAIKEFEEIQPGDVPNTFADTKLLNLVIGKKIYTDLSTGIINLLIGIKNITISKY